MPVVRSGNNMKLKSTVNLMMSFLVMFNTMIGRFNVVFGVAIIFFLFFFILYAEMIEGDF